MDSYNFGSISIILEPGDSAVATTNISIASKARLLTIYNEKVLIYQATSPSPAPTLGLPALISQTMASKSSLTPRSRLLVDKFCYPFPSLPSPPMTSSTNSSAVPNQQSTRPSRRCTPHQLSHAQATLLPRPPQTQLIQAALRRLLERASGSLIASRLLLLISRRARARLG